MAEWKDVVAIGKRFPGVEEGTWYGTPGLKVAGKGGFCRLRTDPDALVMRVPDEEDKEALLVRLEKVGQEQLEELVEDGWRIRATKKLIAQFDGYGGEGEDA